ncbi:ligase-associated DNA damage response endonuclease PdeM [Hoeflea prorocentri]|uniref:Ligase-associated DNA damage response endonuclease PdeM n=2 Tax=Hoeflea prorocentri TaxID=1922333 RepID=A0A9X3UKI0_9HYPH|nr:ligase-associated DNA damage response endonuclease PdeM [Hoeflea prorocentri]MCY6382508.1 ligase-associated DNA damage response endonuclease PdeM [Hoeflea prorocentri]MDA5400308.1 ligase-associated DNA damage response endonuclease PdeM [Hoeflea prorocentri]
MISTAEIVINDTLAVCDPLGSLYLPDSDTLVVSDLHLETGAAYARRGMMLPPYDTALTLTLLTSVIERYRPARVVSLGDSFHDRRGASALPEASQLQIRALMAGREWFWIAGNHDPDHPDGLAGDCVQELYLDGLCFRHEPLENEDATGEIAGHLHPAARVVRRGKGVRRPCFATDGQRLIMPAFGVTTGGLNIRNAAFDGLFDLQSLTAHLLGRERIYSVPFGRLIG